MVASVTAAEKLKEKGERSNLDLAVWGHDGLNTRVGRLGEKQVLQWGGIKVCTPITLREKAAGHVTPAPWPQMGSTVVDSTPAEPIGLTEDFRCSDSS